MATIENRSPIYVVVPKRPALARTFAFNARKPATAYLRELLQQGHEPQVEQGDSAWQVRF